MSEKLQEELLNKFSLKSNDIFLKNKLYYHIKSFKDKLREYIENNQETEPEEEIHEVLRLEFEILMEYYGDTQKNFNKILDQLSPQLKGELELFLAKNLKKQNERLANRNPLFPK